MVVVPLTVFSLKRSTAGAFAVLFRLLSWLKMTGELVPLRGEKSLSNAHKTVVKHTHLFSMEFLPSTGTYLVFHWTPFSCFLIAWLICQPCTSLRRKNSLQVSCGFSYWIALTWMSQGKSMKAGICGIHVLPCLLLFFCRHAACSVQTVDLQHPAIKHNLHQLRTFTVWYTYTSQADWHCTCLFALVIIQF